jgi:hypothetical protein
VEYGGDAMYLPNDTNVFLYNDLFAGCGTVLEGCNFSVDAENITADCITNFVVWDCGGLSSGTIVNSILTACGGMSLALGPGCVQADSGAGLYQSVGDGNYYLAGGSPYRGAGTANIDPLLLADLRTKTTHPPLVYSNQTISADTTLGIAAVRDPCNPGPDLGYHYDALDHVFGGTTVNANLAFTPGAAVGWFRTTSGWYHAGYGICMGNSKIATFQGTEEAPVWWVRANTVQEGNPNAPWQGGYGPGGLVGEDDQDDENIAISPEARLFFTRCAVLADGENGCGQHFRDDSGYLILRATHSEFHGGQTCYGYVNSCYFTNCLMDRTSCAQVEGWPGNEYIVRNCTFHGGAFYMAPDYTAIPISVRDSAFDGTSILDYNYGTGTNADYGYNAFINSTNLFAIGGTGGVAVTNFNWQTSWLGDYYLPSDSALIDAGDVTADVVGLYHFTTQTSQVPEGFSQVDIGYHYVAVDGNGNPLVSNTNGVPDYLADANGNGLIDPGEIPWTDSTAPIQFTVAATNQYVNTATVPLQLTIQSGVPYDYAVMLDSTNFPAAGWTACTSRNITANLGTNQGWHTVWVGLSGPSDNPQTWNAICLNLNFTGPVLAVTNATNVTIPMLQLQGYANEELASLTYDLANAGGTISNQPGYMTGAVFDTNSFSYTNCAFECLDLVLASGVNTVTLHAADLAGNLTTSNFVFHLDYSSKPAPVIQLYWPQDGTQIGGSSFTWRGTVDDPTVALSAQISDTNGDTNVVAGLVERNGNFWVDNIPLYGGTNYLALTATDINSNTTTTNITVVQSSVQLTINPITDDLYQPTVCVSGTINTSGYTVWVNGVVASQSGSAPSISWTAYTVPLNGEGCAVIQARAIPNADNNGNGTGPGGGGTNSTLSNPGNPPAPDATDWPITPDRKARIYCTFLFLHWLGECLAFGNPGNTLSQSNIYSETAHWWYETGGSSEATSCTTQIMQNGSLDNCHYGLYEHLWDTNGDDILLFGSTTNGCGTVTNLAPYASSVEPPAFDLATTFPGLNGGSEYSGNTTGWSNYCQISSQSAVATYALTSGGRSVPIRQSLHAIAANAAAIVQPFYDSAIDRWFSNNLPTSGISPQQVTVMGQPEGADGNLWTNLPDGQFFLLSINVPTAPYYYVRPTDTNYPLHIYFNGNDVTDSNTSVMVGQQINLTCSLGQSAPACSNGYWTVPDTAESQFYVSGDPLWTNGYPIDFTTNMCANTNGVFFFWADGSFNGLTKTVSCSADVFSQKCTGWTTFTVFRPNVTNAYTTGSVSMGYADTNFNLDFGTAGQGDVGILFSNTITIPPGFTNTLGAFSTRWVQLIPSHSANIVISNSVGHVTNYVHQSVVTCLDTTYPYNDPNETQKNPIDDSPFIALGYVNQVSASDTQNSQMWLMFQPGGSTNWVPLWITTWNCTGTAAGFGPNPSNWSLTGTNISVLSNADSDTRYPIWTNNIRNIPWDPPLPTH